MATNVRYSLPPSSNGHVKGSGAAGPAPLPHIDDVVALPRDIDTNQSMKRLLESAETSLRQAEMSRDFNRPALAMKDYIRASVIAVQVIANHKDYPSLKGGRTDLAQVHSALLKKITNQNDIYEKIKQDIIADNRKSGVLPASKRQTNGGHVRQASVPNGSAHSSSTFGQPVSTNSAGKVKPTVQPKPHSLQGNAVSGHGRSSSTTTVNVDLAARFANLRGPQASPGQDPRIKTHPIPPLKPAGPREMPSPHKSKPSIDLGMPTLPKMPDATYNPTRGGSVSGDTGRPPQSTPRSLYSRNESSTSLSSIQSTGPSSQQNEYFPPMPVNNSGTKKTSAASSLIVSQNDSITPEELFEAMKQKGSVLIIDIRSREDFDEGHIMSSSTICIEPSVLLRENLSADEISESLVLSPNQEQDLFEQRNKYNLVVFYDQDSEEIPRSPRNSDDLVVVSMHRALVHFNYGYELRQAPKILKGGLDAWIDLMGSAALQSVSAKPGSAQQVTPARRRNGTFQRRRSKYLVRPLRPDEVKAWQETLENEEMNAATVPSFHRSTESFLRRYPPVISEQESMTSPSVSEQPPRYGSSHKGDLYTDLPSPPSRPAPAVPRLSYSSLSHTNDDTELYHEPATPTAPRPAVRNSKVSEQSTGDGIKFYTGLNNPHNWCYANSTLQSLLASPDFGKELADSVWTSRYKAPRKENEKIDHPQLMIRIVSNLFHWMSTGKFEVMKAQTLMDYSRHICKQSHSNAQFGGTQQQDAQEFMSFVMEHLHDETNSRRHNKGNAHQPNTKSQSLIQAASQYWNKHLEYNDSIVDRYWRGLELSTVQCLDCHTKTYTFSPFEWIPAPVVMSGEKQTLEQSLHQHIANNTLDDFSCDQCRRNTKAMQSISFARLPPLLCVCFRRFNYNQSTGDIKKSTAPVTWDFNDLDFSPYFLDNGRRGGGGGSSSADRAFEGPFRYECYAVIVHAGSRTDNGHYFAFVRDQSTHDPYAWFCCNDGRVTRVRIGSGDKDDVQGQVFKSGQDRVPYLVFFRRKG